MTLKNLRMSLSIAAVASLALVACSDDQSADENGAEGEEETAEQEEQAPQLSEIEDQMWDSMESAESVTMEADETALNDVDDEFSDYLTDSDTVQISGALDGSFTTIGAPDEEPLILMTEEGSYLQGRMFSALILAELEGQVDVDPDELEAELDGLWVDFSDDLDGDDRLVLQDLIQESRESWDDPEEDAEDALVSRSTLSEEGETEEREGETVWVYTDDQGGEIVVAADESAPYLLEINGEDSVVFSEWDEVSEPDAPSEDEIVDQQELELIIEDLIQQ